MQPPAQRTPGAIARTKSERSPWSTKKGRENAGFSLSMAPGEGDTLASDRLMRRVVIAGWSRGGVVCWPRRTPSWRSTRPTGTAGRRGGFGRTRIVSLTQAGAGVSRVAFRRYTKPPRKEPRRNSLSSVDQITSTPLRHTVRPPRDARRSGGVVSRPITTWPGT